MRRTSKVIATALLATVVLFAAAGHALAQDATVGTTKPGTRRALLIGVNRYTTREIPNLRGAVNDIELMAGILTTRFGFDRENVKLLKDEAATRAGILAALTEIAVSAGPQDVVYIHYSGHGSQVADKGDDEEDGRDETIIPHDGRTPGIADVTDDEIGLCLAGMETNRVVVVLDSCHSGTGTRSVGLVARSIPMDTRDDLYSVSSRAVAPMEATYALFTGAHSTQSALDGPCDGRFHGLFTYSLSRSLGRRGGAESLLTIMEGVGREMNRLKEQFGLLSMPEPQLECSSERMSEPLFPVRTVAPAPAPETAPSASETAPSSPESVANLPWLLIEKKASHVVLKQAQAMGAVPGTIWAVYPPNETQFGPGRAAAIATITEMRGADGIARLSPDTAIVFSGARAVQIASAPSSRVVPIRLAGSGTAAIAAKLSKLVDYARFVGDDELARFNVRVEGDRLVVTGATGDEEVASFSARDPDKVAEGLATLVRRSAVASELLALDNPSSGMYLDVGLVTERSASQRDVVTRGARGVQVVADVGRNDYRVKRNGDTRSAENSLTIRVSVGQPCYLTVVDVDSAGGVNLLFPFSGQKQGYYPDGLLQSPQELLIPDSLRTGNESGFHWDIAPPIGTDSVRVFATTDLPTAEMIRQYVAEAAAAERGDGAKMAEILSRLRCALASRAVHVVADRPEEEGTGGGTVDTEPPPEVYTDWTAVTVTFEVGD